MTLLAAAALHPFLSYPLSLWLLRRWRPRQIAAGPVTGKAAICVCFYNEEAVARDKVENLLSMQSKVAGLELLAYVDAATDRTADILMRSTPIAFVLLSRRSATGKPMA